MCSSPPYAFTSPLLLRPPPPPHSHPLPPHSHPLPPKSRSRRHIVCVTRTTPPKPKSPSKPPLPPSSTKALSCAGALTTTALTLPALLALQTSTPLHSLTHTYISHYQMILYNALFATLHSGLASLRPHVTPYIGERFYRVIFALTSLPSAGLLIAFFIAHRYDGVQLWQLQGVPGVHEAVFVITLVSFLLLYPATFNLAEVAAIAKPGFRMYETGVTRITRHPQLWGQLLWCISHCMWIGSSFCVVASLGLVAHHCLGAWNGDRRLRDRFGEEWAEFERRTSLVPFAAVLRRGQRIVWGEFVRWAYVGVVAFVVAGYMAHPSVLRFVGELKL